MTESRSGSRAAPPEQLDREYEAHLRGRPRRDEHEPGQREEGHLRAEGRDRLRTQERDESAGAEHAEDLRLPLRDRRCRRSRSAASLIHPIRAMSPCHREAELQE